MTNLLIAIKNIIQNPINDIILNYKGSNRANSSGYALEQYIKDVFCNSFFEKDIEKKDQIFGQYFSYLGNQNNPPDAIIRGGDAIEIKKIENFTSALALNSSYPKDKLHYDDSRITNECRSSEKDKWQQKDIIYVVGVSLKNSQKIKSICFIYGNCYAAKKEIYTRIADKISKGISQIPDVEFIATNELAKVKKVDPLGITDLRVRGMWHIENPIKVFKNFIQIADEKTLYVNAIILEEKYLSFPKIDISNLESLQSDYLKISNIKIKSPNNPASLLNAKLISYAK
jgi:hypothetical protein